MPPPPTQPKLILCSSGAHTAHFIGDELPRPNHEYRVLFVTTAAEGEPGETEWWVSLDRAGLQRAGFQITDFTISGKTAAAVRSALVNTDIVFVNGGNTYYLLDKMRQIDFKSTLEEFLAKGGVYASSSAGSIVTGPDISPAKRIENFEHFPKLAELDPTGLGLVEFVVLPHWGSKAFRQKYVEGDRLNQAYDSGQAIVLLNDNQYVVVRDQQFQIRTIDRALARPSRESG